MKAIKIKKTLEKLEKEVAFLSQNEMQDISGGSHVKIGVNRFGYGESSTCSRFIANAYDDNGYLIAFMSGYFLEPGVDVNNSCIAGSDTAIPSSEYNLVSTTYHGESGYYEVTGVSGRNGIKLHVGNDGEDTSGCLLFGTGYSYNEETNEYEVSGSTNKMNEFNDFMDRYSSSGKATINISM